MAVGGFKKLFIGLIIFVIASSLITTLITGTDSGSTLLQNVLLIVIAGAILLGVIMSFGGSK